MFEKLSDALPSVNVEISVEDKTPAEYVRSVRDNTKQSAQESKDEMVRKSAEAYKKRADAANRTVEDIRNEMADAIGVDRDTVADGSGEEA